MQTRSLYLLLCLGLLAGSAAAAGPALADDGICATRAKVLAHLSHEYHEVSVAVGNANNGGVIEIMRSADRETFTIIITMPGGMTCMIVAGNDWRDLPVRAQDARF